MCDSVKNLQRGRVFWIIQVGPTCDHKGLNKGQREAGGQRRRDRAEIREERTCCAAGTDGRRGQAKDARGPQELEKART